MIIRGPKFSFEMSDREHNDFKNLVVEKLELVYGKDSFSKVDGIWGNFLEPVEGIENPNRIKSILNYLNTNILFREMICRKKPSISNYSDLRDYFDKNYQKFIEKSGEYFGQVLQLLERTEEKGVLNELSAIPRLKRGLKEKLSLDVDVYRTETDSKDDLIFGIDIYYLEDGQMVGCQVKPLVSFREDLDQIIIESSGLIKRYRGIKFLIFIDRHSSEKPDEEKYVRGTKFFIFYNDPIEIQNKTLIFSKGSLFYTNQIA